MALTTNKQKLFTLFSACLPDNESVQRELLIEAIAEMPEYALVMARPCWKYLSKVYSTESLKKQDISTLKRLPSAIKLVPDTLELLEASVQHGDAWKLSAKDMPDWTSANSINALSKKLHYSEDKTNITNITRANILTIFLDNVVRDPAPLLKNWTVSNCMNIELSVQKALEGKLYCIPKDAFEHQNELIAKSDSLIAEIQNSKKQSKHLVLTKKVCTVVSGLLLSLLAPDAFNMPGEGAGLFYILSSVISIVYLIKG